MTTQAYTLTLHIGKDEAVSKRLWKEVGECAQAGHKILKVLRDVGIDAQFGIKATSQ